MALSSGPMNRLSPTGNRLHPCPPVLRAFRGLNWTGVGLVACVCAVWTLSSLYHDFYPSWINGTMLPFLLFIVGGSFVTALLIAIAMGLPILAVGNLGPQSGWQRIAALALVIALVAPAGAVLRLTYLELLNGLDDGPSPPRPDYWFQLFWFRYAQQAALLTILWEFHRLETRNVQAMHEAEIDRLALDREMAEARLQVLQAQIEPHFLFNTLANVRRLYQMDLDAGRRMLDNLMRYLEVALPSMRQSHSTLGRELDLIGAYLSVQGVRMGRRLAVTIDVPPVLQAIDMPPMMLLTLVENAIKHGLNPQLKGGTIVITAHREGDRLRLDVIDDGRGFGASSGGGIGLANVRARLRALHGDAASLTLVENVQRGVTSTLRLPAGQRAEEVQT